MNNMYKSLKRHSIKKTLGSFCFILIFLFITVLGTTATTNAFPEFDQAPTRRTYLASRWVEHLLQCISKSDAVNDKPIRDEITKAEAAKMDIFDNRSGVAFDEVKTGFDLDTDDANMSCQELETEAKDAIKKLGIEPLDFVKKFYTLDGDKYKFNGGDAVTLAKDYLTKTIVTSGRSGEMRKIRLAIAFSQCFEEAGDVSVADSDTPNLSKPFYYRDGYNAGKDIVVGKDFYSNDSYSCATLANLAKTEGLLALMAEFDVTTDILKNNPINFYAMIAAGAAVDEQTDEALPAVIAKINSNVGAVMQCLSATQIRVDNNETLAEWLLSGDISLLDDISNPGNPPSSEREAALLQCMTDAISGLEDVIQEYNDDVDAINDNLQDVLTQDGGDDGDKCLTKSDQFIAWAACPIIKIIDDFLTKLEKAIRSTLSFDLATQDQGGNLKDAWNIFRGLATTLIIAGFMLALVIKGIKG